MIDSDGNRAAIYDRVEAMKKIMKPEDELLFFFSGHGAKGKAADYDHSNVDQSIVVYNENETGFDYIWDGELKDLFTGFKTSRIIFIFDSCLSGGMSVLKDTVRVVNMASTANGLSYEGQWGGGHGQFTYYFVIEGMGNIAADRSSDDKVTVEEAFDYTKANCLWQTPTIADGFTNDLLP